MLKKMLKYEFSSFARTILPMEIILLGIALATRFTQFFENSGKTYKFFNISSIVLLVIAMLVCIIMTVVVCTVRFYRNMYTNEGYLTLTLPVTHRTHIFAKLITAVVASAASLVSVILALMIATAGDVFNEIVKAAVYLVKQMYGFMGISLIFYGLEILIGVIVFTAGVYLLFYACITVGQMANKNRILAAFGTYFGYYVFRQIVGTLLIVLYVNIYEYLPLKQILSWIDNNPKAFFHLLFIGITVIAAVFALIYFVITEKLMKKHLNIE